MKAIVKSLKPHIRPRRTEIVEECFTKVVKDGSAKFTDIGDIFCYSDGHLERISRIIRPERWCEIFSISIRNYCRRPTERQSIVSQFQGISVEDLAHLLINIERVGYTVNPLSLVNQLLPMLADRPFVNDSELDIIWYKKSRHKMDSIHFYVKADEIGQRRNKEKFMTTTGYKAEVVRNENDEPVQLIIKAPKYRSKPAPKSTTCDVCGYTWLQGIKEESAAHRKEHNRHMKYLDPKPYRRLSKVNQDQDGLVLVTSNSSKWRHGVIYLRALAFKREFGYDFIPWESPEGNPDPSARGYLFMNPDNIVVGACAIWPYEYKDKAIWSLQWIWITRKYRRSGVLTKHWKTFRQRYGDFHLEQPVSDAMVAFLEKNGDKYLLEKNMASD
ncbi:MAG: hypothetical protein OXE42_08625 [Gammaproteobacteria bacterium]|nr:hypothetical protein [Gammaproteobacteria bacterium]